MITIQTRCWKICAIVVLAAAGLTMPALAQISQQRPLTPDDLFRLEGLGQVTLSPDGKWLAYVIRRPKATALHHIQTFLFGHDRGDVWLVEVGKGKPRNLTNGVADGSGYWSPTWSPDGQRLSMLSTKGGNVRLWVWEKSTGQLKQLSDRGVGLLFQDNPCVWLSDRQLVCPILPEGQRPGPMIADRRAGQTAMSEWPKAWKGQEPTASLLESGVPILLDKRPQWQLVLIDVSKGSQHLLSGASFRDLRLSPDKQRVAVLKQMDVRRPEPNRLVNFGNADEIYQAAVVSSSGALTLANLPNVKDVEIGSMRWSPDGTALALIGQVSGGSRPQVVRCKMAEETCQAISSNEIEPLAIDWSARNKLLVLAKPVVGDGTQNSRTDWWIIEANAPVRNITASMKSPPGELVREADGESFVGLAGGDLWRIRVDGSEAQNLTASFEPRISSVLWPKSAEDLSGVRQGILRVRRETMEDLYRLDLSSGQTTALSKPSTGATLVEFSAQGEAAVFKANDRTGAYLWLSHPAFVQFSPLVKTNTFLSEIAQGEFKKIEYRSLDGQDLKGWVILPVGYQEGKRYPLVTWVYAGSVAGSTPTSQANIDYASPLNLQLLAARGYAVLIPSMPLRPGGEASDPYMEMTKGVLPAIDKLIDAGIADPKRLGVMGHSYGGYSTYSLVTQTNRFQAAVSMAGISDLVSRYNVVDPRLRYDEFPHDRRFYMGIAESGQIRMGNPPWKDAGRYLRNSPLFYVERVETPLMIIQGDMDYLAMQQGELFFTALYRQKKRAAFVRYWGEGHLLDSPANIRDMWQRIYAWFDEFLKKPETNSSAPVTPK